MATIFITGGLGFLGSHLVDAYRAQGDRVIVVDHHKKEKLRFFEGDTDIHRYDFSDARVRDILMETRPDVVFHLAAQISVTHSVLFPTEDAQKNILASVRFLEWCKDAGVRKVVFSSSGGAMYGDHPVRPTPLLHNAQPLSPYGLSKQAFEHYLESAYNTQGISYVSLRFANLYGPRQQVTKPMGEGNVISLFLDKLLVTGEPFTVFGDGSATRDYVFVQDAVDALIGAAQFAGSGTINVGSGKETSVNDLIEFLKKIHGVDHSIVYAPFRVGEVYRSVLDPESAREMLGWEARVSFRDGLQQTYDWYRKTFGT